MPIQHLMILLIVAEQEELERSIEINKICECIGCTLASASRISDYLSNKGWGNKKGMVYIARLQDRLLQPTA